MKHSHSYLHPHSLPLTLFRSLLLPLLMLVFGSHATESFAQADFNIVPRPAEVTTLDGEPFVLNADTRICCTKAAKRNALFLQQYVKERTGFMLPVTKKAAATNAIALRVVPGTLAPEAYRISVGEAGITIEGGSDAGLFYGIQTLRKALPHRLVNMQNPRVSDEQRKVSIPAVSIADQPRFAYRGAHLDVSRHYVTPDSIRRFIDMLALHNINRFHWHITDDQGWRLEIKKYPRLTTVGSQRSETVIGHNSGRYDGIPYGGFYTQKECKAIVKYAAERNIIVIPEIDMPGHMLGALAAYPELGCTGGPYDVWRIWGVSEDVLCAGNDKTLQFIDDVLDEVCKIFPSEYIHVGGDECPKEAWKKCAKCQARIKAEGLEARDGHSAEERLQSYVIRHAEAHLAKLGRKMIGWDETLEGGLADGATVMSWRGEEGGIEAARQHHDVIMTPNSYLYFDYYQSLNTSSEPDAIGGYLPLKRVYDYEPVPESLMAALPNTAKDSSQPEDLSQYIIGVQANCWTEYMPTYRQIEYMELPRMAALAEVQWTPRGTKDYDDFLQRTLRLMGLYDELGYNYAQHIYDVRGTYGTDPEERCITAELSSALPLDIHYTLDGTEPTQSSPVFDGTIAIKADSKLRAATFRPVEARPGSVARRYQISNVEGADFHFNKATASPIVLLGQPAPRYTFAGGAALVDGIQATGTNFQTGQWIGFNGTDLDAIIDLGTEQTITSVSINTCVGKGDWIFDVGGLEVMTPKSDVEQGYELLFQEENIAPSAIMPELDGWNTLVKDDYPLDDKDAPNGIRTHTITFPAVTARFLRVKAPCLKAIPDWHVGRGKPAFIFVDEIMVN